MRGGAREGAGRPKKQPTARKPITWRLPVDLLVRIAIRAEHEGIPVTTWVERELTRSLKRMPTLK
jgi:predicted HicB family RNase H-like nuclease